MIASTFHEQMPPKISYGITRVSVNARNITGVSYGVASLGKLYGIVGCADARANMAGMKLGIDNITS